ncbi:erythromycin esterase family protein [Aquimarina sp. MMG016]|uniref:erythromycin esterase family protein n=1 Tax=Aquimarina sp. MMG016 TaxID=2822690 RepID=UPI001B3A4C7C|nr:erythromycin esterase family protein [Aquimarina sp. MMG016]MBQ4818852.1 erythromycin esterase family protein [Aquimarina sp. MMG016]
MNIYTFKMSVDYFKKKGIKKINFLNTFLFLVFTFVSNNIFSQKTSLSFQEGKEMKVIGNEIHDYTLPLTKGDFVQLHLRQKNVNLQIIASIPEKDTLQGFLGNFRQDGLEIVELPIKKSDTYTFKVSPYISKWLKDSARQAFIKNIKGGYIVEKFRVLSPKEYKALIAYRKAQQDSVITWIKKKSIPLNSVRAETGFSDLEHLKPILQNVRIVGMGETSHGTKEIFQMKHRMLEFLVKEMGFTLFGIEASHIGCQPINDYVLYGKGSSREALNEQGFWIWNVESVIDMIEWMHHYNKTVPEVKKVKFIGIDTQTVGLDLAYKNISDFIDKTDPHPLLEVQVDSLFQDIKTITDRSDLSDQRQQLYRVLSYLHVNEMRLVSTSSTKEYRKVLTDLRKIIQGLETYNRKLEKKAGFNIRDEYMAQTVLEVLEKEGPDAKMMLWAHNTHINKNPDAYTNGSQKPLGSVLEKYLGDTAYFAMGFSTYQGTFQARSYFKKGKEYVYDKVGSFTIFPEKEGSLDWYFMQAEKDKFYIDFTSYPNHNAIHSFMHKDISMHTAFSNWAFGRTYSPSIKIVSKKAFDGMIFIKETSASTLTPGGEKEIEKRIQNGK